MIEKFREMYESKSQDSMTEAKEASTELQLKVIDVSDLNKLGDSDEVQEQIAEAFSQAIAETVVQQLRDHFL